MSNSTLKSYASKVAGGVAGVTMLAMSAMSVGAQSVSIEQLLAQIAQLQAQLVSLQGGSTSGSTGVSYNFTRNLQVGSTGEDVRMLQKALNASADTRVASTGAGSPGAETTYFGPATKAAVIKFQNKYASEVLTPSGLTAGTGFVGPASRAKLNSMSTGTGTGTGTGTTPVTGAMSATLAATSPMQGAVIAGQALANLAEYTFTNGSGVESVVTKVVVNRGGISNDSAFTNVYLYEGGKRISDSATVSNGIITFNDGAGLFRIPNGGTKTISVRADISSSATGQVLGVELASVTANTTVSGSFPIKGSYMSVATATLATADFNSTTLPSASSVAPQNEYTVWQNTVSIGNHAVNLRSVSLRNVGSIATGDINNFKLYVDGVQISTAAGMDSNGYVTFDLSTPKRLETGGRVIKVVGDIIGGSTRTFQFQLRQTGDVMLIDAELNQPILPTAGGSTFSARSATSATIDGGAMSVTKANSSPTSNVSVGASGVKLATFEFRASGERVKVESLDVQANVTGYENGGLDNGKVFVNGVQVGSTKDLTEATDVNFTFGSSFIVEAGQTAIVDIYADTKTTTGTTYTNGATVAITIGAGSSNAQGMSSLNSLSIPGSDTTANTITMSSSSMTVTKFSGYGNQTREAGTQNARLGSFVLSAGSTEGVNVNNITITLSSDEAATVTNLKLVDNSTGAQIGSTKTTPSTSNSFGVNFNVPTSGTKVVDIVGDILSGSDAGSWIATVDQVDGTGSATGNSASYTTDVILQTITVGSGSLSLNSDSSVSSYSNNNNVIAGASGAKAGKFKFTGVNSDFTVQELKVKIGNDAATSVSAVTLRYKDTNGVTQTASQALAINASYAYATATFTGLTMAVPANGDAYLEVLVDTATIANGAKSGAGINVSIDYNEGFKAVSGSGTVSTSVGSADVSAPGTFYVRRSIPTFTRVDLTNAPSSSSALYQFTLVADTAGAIEVKKLTFDVVTTGVTIADFYLREVGQSSNVNDATPEADSSNDVAIFVGGQYDSDVISVGAGTSKTFQLFGTVTGWGDTGDSITITFAEDSSSTVTASSATFTTEELVWSDLSITGAAHTTITADWTNGYLIKDFSDDVESYSS